MLTYLPEYAVYCVPQEAVPALRRHQLRSQNGHKFIKIHLAIPWNERERSETQKSERRLGWKGLLEAIYCNTLM